MALEKKISILVVDDNPEIMKITIRGLETEDYKIFSATTGTECLEVLRREKPDMILLDVVLPDMSGNDLTRQIKNDPEFSKVFIILLSSVNINSDHVVEGLENGADGFISRPISMRELNARVASSCRIIHAERESKSAISKWRSLFMAMQEGVFIHEMIYSPEGKAID